MTTNNAPERIELGNGYSLRREYLGKGQAFYRLYNGVSMCTPPFDVGFALDFAAAMQPVPSKSDEAVAREIMSIVRDPHHWHKEKAVVAILARHRQPVAVSADAVDEEEIAANLIREVDGSASPNNLEWMAARLKAYGDQRELNGARKMQETAKQALGDIPVALTRIRALSPETICGGGE